MLEDCVGTGEGVVVCPSEPIVNDDLDEPPITVAVASDEDVKVNSEAEVEVGLEDEIEARVELDVPLVAVTALPKTGA